MERIASTSEHAGPAAGRGRPQWSHAAQTQDGVFSASTSGSKHVHYGPQAAPALRCESGCVCAPDLDLHSSDQRSEPQAPRSMAAAMAGLQETVLQYCDLPGPPSRQPKCGTGGSSREGEMVLRTGTERPQSVVLREREQSFMMSWQQQIIARYGLRNG